MQRIIQLRFVIVHVREFSSTNEIAVVKSTLCFKVKFECMGRELIQTGVMQMLLPTNLRHIIFILVVIVMVIVTAAILGQESRRP